MATDSQPVSNDMNKKIYITEVIDKTNYLDYVLKNIIIKYISPSHDKTDFVRDILFNSSVLNFGSKTKVFFNIVQKEKWDSIGSEHFFKIMSYRNAIAHSDTVTGYVDAVVSEEKVEVIDEYYLLNLFHSSGKLKLVKSSDAITEFQQSFLIVRDYLHQIESLLDSGSSPK